MSARIAFALWVAAVTGLVAHGTPAASTTLSGTLKSVGADTMATLTRYWIELLTKAHPAVHVEMEAKGPGTGAPALTSGSAQLATLPRKMLDGEVSDFVKKYGYEPFAVRVAGGSYRSPKMTHAIFFFVNKENPIDKLTFAQLDAIFSTTRKRGYKEPIQTWGQLGLQGEWANQKIRLWGFSVPNGVANFVQERVLAGGAYRLGIHDRTASDPLATMDTIVQGIAADRYSIGYAGLANARPEVKAIAVAENDDGPFFKGTLDEVATHAYPLSRFVYIYVNRPPGKPLAPLVKAFLAMVLSTQGQEAVVREGVFLPLPAAVVREERSRLE